MRVLVIGGTGRTGKLVISDLLQRGHTVTALVRDAQSLDRRDGLKVVTGTPMSISDIRSAVQAAGGEVPKVVIVTLNAPRESENPFAKPISPPRLMADSNTNVVTIMKEFGIPKIVIMQAFGVGQSWANMHFLLRLFMSKSNMRLQYDDHNFVDQEVRGSGVTYVLVRPSRLVEGQAGHVTEWKDHGKNVGLMASISRKSVAGWLVDAALDTRWDNTCPVITH
jgi:hypothetical protein